MNSGERTEGKLLSFQIADIAYSLPEKILSNEELAKRYEGWSADKIFAKTGIKTRHVLSENEYISDVALSAVNTLKKQSNLDLNQVDALILCTQTPDYALPGTSSLLHKRLNLSSHCLTFDFNHGCTGFIYGLSIAGSMIHSGLIENAIAIFAESYSRWCHPLDKSVSTIFGDGAAAVYLTKTVREKGVGPFLFGTDGEGFMNLTVPQSGAHLKISNGKGIEEEKDTSGNIRTPLNLLMNGPELFRFAISTVPDAITDLLKKASLQLEDIDKFVFHQANKFMLENLRKISGIPLEKMIYGIEDTGNTVSASIPIAMKKAIDEKKIIPGDKVMLIGFGVGYSWGGTIVTWSPEGG